MAQSRTVKVLALSTGQGLMALVATNARKGIGLVIKLIRGNPVYRWLGSMRKRLRNAIWAFQFGHSFSEIDIDRVDGFEVAYRKASPDENVFRTSFDRDVYFSAVAEYRPRPTDVIIDVGAYIGTFTLLAARKVPQGKVYAIEPCHDTFNLLKINVALNNLKNVQLNCLALADAKGYSHLYYSAESGSWGHSLFRRGSGKGEEIPTDTLSNFMRERGIDHCDFMKMNCEGAEFRILMKTPRETLQRFGVICVEYHCDLERRWSKKDLSSYLQASGFTTTIRTSVEDSGWLIACRTQAGQLPTLDLSGSL